MARAVYLSPGSSMLAGHWLRQSGAEGEIVLLAPDAARSEAEDLRARYPRMVRVAGFPGEPLDAALLEEGVAIPAAPGMSVLRFQPSVRIPDWNPLFPVFRALWLKGFRRFTVCTPAGARTVEIPHMLDAFQGVHAGKRCFVAGNGPSLNAIDMARLNGEITFGANRCFLGYPAWGYSFTYWGIMDRVQIEEYGPEYEENARAESVNFLPFEYLPWMNTPNACPVHFDYEWRLPPRFSEQPDVLHQGYSVVYMLIQIAAYMGCNPIIVIGMDHRYNLRRTWRPLERMRGELAQRLHDTRLYRFYQLWRSSTRAEGAAAPSSHYWEARDATKPTHFTREYTHEKHFARPHPERTEAAMAAASRWAEAHDIQILNATPDSALKAFPLVPFSSLF